MRADFGADGEAGSTDDFDIGDADEVTNQAASSALRSNPEANCGNS